MIIHEIYDEGMILGESFQVVVVIEKLPLAWKDFKNFLRHKRMEMNMEDLVVRLCIEEDNRGSDKKRPHTSTEVRPNFMELGQGSMTKKHNKGKGSKLGPKGGVSEKQKFIGKNFNCRKQGHNDCRLPKRNKPKEAKVVDNISKDVSDIYLTAIIFKVNLVGSNPKELWIDTSATSHVCSDKKMLSIFESLETGEKVFIGNSPTS